MIRIAKKEISVNIQMKKIQREDGSFQSELYVFDPGWGDRHADPVTGQMAKLYEHVLRNMKLSGGIQIYLFNMPHQSQGNPLVNIAAVVCGRCFV